MTYEQPENTTEVKIQGITCYIPETPSPFDIDNNFLPIKEQKWKRTELPTFRALDIEWFSGDEPDDLYEEIDWETARREEIIKQTGGDIWNVNAQGDPKDVRGVEPDPEYVSEVLNDFRVQEYERVFNGYWFFNNGIPTYITGMYYFYLNWWKMDVGYPKYREPDKELFYLIETADLDPRCFGLLYITKRGTGKDIHEDSLVWKESGAVKIKDIKVGDKIYGADGKLTTVTDRFDYDDQLQYEVEFDDGRKVECGEGHLWTLTDYSGKKKTMELGEFKDDFRMKYVRPGGKQDPKYYNSYSKPVEFPKQELPIDPYYLGLHLGDGHQHAPIITNPEQEIFDYVSEYASEIGLEISMYKNTKCKTYSLVSPSGRKNPLKDKMRELGILKMKHIPDIYKYSSVEQRFELLRGLMDTDGYCGKDGSIEFTSSIDSLHKDVRYLLNSLGIKFKVTSRIPTFTYKGEKRNGKRNYRFNIKTGLDVFKLKRKKDNIINSTHNWTVGSRTKVGIKSITPTSVKPSVCIAVDNEDKLFLTNDFIVTHNSFIAGCVAYFQTITNKKAHVGIQSKTDDDAKELFLTKVAEPFKDLPDFLIPINKSGTNPTSGLEFSPRTVTGKRAGVMKRAQRDALRSKMDYKNAGNKAYDGTTLKCLIQDEVGKVEKKVADVYDRWLVNRECVFRDGRKRGFAFFTTTVEEMDKGGEPCKKLWYDSNINELSENGRTKTWIYRYFRSALDSLEFDDYGFPLREQAKAYFDGERKMLQSDPSSMIGYMQKNPYTIEEAFMTQGESCIYNAGILQERQVFLGDENNRKKVVRVGDFAWKEGKKDSEVIFIDNERNGMWEISYLGIDDNFKNKKRKIAEYDGVTQWKPSIKTGRVIGYDPYSHKRTMDTNKASDAGASVFQKFDFHVPEEHSETIIADFAGRYANPGDAHEQVIMCAVYFGAEILAESNKQGGITYIEERGYSEYLMDRPSNSGSREHYRGVKGMPSSTASIGYYVELTRTHINEHGHKLKHLRVVRDWLDFNPLDTTKYDSGVGASYSIVGAHKPVIGTENTVELSNFFSTFDHSGNSGKINT